jgi:Protein of unknown function (DUF2867)
VEPNIQGSVIRQTAIFDLAGLAGFVYWYALYLIHRWIFSRMLRSIAVMAEHWAEVAFGRCAHSLGMVPLCPLLGQLRGHFGWA